MKKILFTLTFILFATSAIHAQKIDINIPLEANKPYHLIINKGLEADTIASGTLSEQGVIALEMPAILKDYKGMAYICIGENRPILAVLNKEDFQIREERGEIKTDGSEENATLNKFVKGEITHITDTTLYSHQFSHYILYMRRINKAISQPADINEKQAIIAQAKQLNFDLLYTSGLWYHVIDGIIKTSNNNQDALASTMIEIMGKIQSPIVFTHLTENLIHVMGEQGNKKALEDVIFYAKESGKIPTPQGCIFDAFQSIKVMIGDTAPTIIGLASNYPSEYETILLLYYHPECKECESDIKQLIKEYDLLKHKKVRIVSISSDSEKKSFEIDRSRLPWSDILCDYQGYVGDNFVNYGVIGTPSYFLLEKNQTLIGKYSSLKDVPLK